MRKRLAATPIDPSAQPSRRTASVWVRSSARLSGAVFDRLALELHEDPRERPLRLRSEPARRALSAQEEVAGDARDGRDRERERAGEHDRAVDLTGEEQQDERDKRKQEAADRREQERAERREAGGVRRVASAAEVAVLDDAGGWRREQLPREVRGEVRLASPPQTEPRQKRPIHQGLGGNARKPERQQDDHLPRIELRERLPDFFVVDELRQQPREHERERRDYEHGPEQAPPQRPRHGCGRSVLHEALEAHSEAMGGAYPGEDWLLSAWRP